mgnify:FL=1
MTYYQEYTSKITEYYSKNFYINSLKNLQITCEQLGGQECINCLILGGSKNYRYKYLKYKHKLNKLMNKFSSYQ